MIIIIIIFIFFKQHDKIITNRNCVSYKLITINVRNPTAQLSGVISLLITTLEKTANTHHQHRYGLSKDGVEEIKRSSSSDHEEITDEEVLTTTVVKHCILQTAEQTLEWILHKSQKQIKNIHLFWKKTND